MPSLEVDAAAELLERLLTDAGFRSRFRAGPAEACRDFGLDDLAQELDGSMKAVFTLEARESKSSLAGVVMAAAAEGIGAFELSHHITPGMSHDAAAAVHTALSRTGMRAVSVHDVSGSAGHAVTAGATAGAAPGGGSMAGIPAVGAGADHASAAGGNGAAAAAQTPAGPSAASSAGAPSASAAAAPAPAAAPPVTDSAGASAAQAATASAPPVTPSAPVDTASPAAGATVAPGAPDVTQGQGGGANAVDSANASPAGGSAHAIHDQAVAGKAPDGSQLPAGDWSSVTGQKVVKLAEAHLGLPYVWGGTSPKSGFDCSGLTQWAYHQAGIDIPRVAEDQFHAGTAVSLHHLREGDLVFFKDPTGYIHHVGMYIGGDKFIHAPHTGDHVKISSLDEPYFKSQFAGGRRFAAVTAPPGGGGAPAAVTPAVASTNAAAGVTADPSAGAAVAPAAPAAPVVPEAAPAPTAAVPELPPVQPAKHATAVLAALTQQEASYHRNTVSVMAAIRPDQVQPAGAAQLAGAPVPGVAANAAALPVTAPAGPAHALAPSGAAVDPAVVPTGGGGASPLGSAALQVAHSQLGVREIGSTNTGPQVDKYLAAAKVGPGNPWCASFVTWSLEHAGHKMPGGGWAAVSTWVHNAEARTNNLQIVKPGDARPGDIVAYDWGGGNDFGNDGHIGFLASHVHNGQFTALEGNNGDAVHQVPRHLGGGPNIVFMRIGGTGTAPAPDPSALTPATPGAALTPNAVVDPTAAPGAPAAAVADAPATPGAPVIPAPAASPHASAAMAAIQAPTAAPGGHGTVSGLGAVGADQHAAAGQAVPAAPAPGDVPGGGANLADVSDVYPGDKAPKAEIAAWMAHLAEKRGIPGQLPVMASLVESGLFNNPNQLDHDSVGYFQMRVGIWDEGPYKGFSGHPDLQVKWFLDQAESVQKQWIASGHGADLKNPHKFGDWIADVERPAEQYRGRYQLRLGDANALLHSAAPAAPPAAVPVTAPAGPAHALAPYTPGTGAVDPTAAAGGGGGGGSPLGQAALQIAHTQKGVHEIGSTNTGPQVDKYLAAAQVGPGNPWCASFVTWSLEHAGHKMPGGGWAAVSTWVHNAEARTNNLQIVKPGDARPGDLVAYDWGGGNDFGNDGHIGFLASNVHNGQFTALEGNNGDAVAQVPRHLGGGPNIVFMRIGGSAPAPGAASLTPGGAVDPSALPGQGAGSNAAAIDPAAAPAAAPPVTPGAPHQTAAMAAIEQPKVAPHANTVQFMRAITPQDAAAHAAAAADPALAQQPAGGAAVTDQAPGTAGANSSGAGVADVPGGSASVDMASYPGDNATKPEIAAWMSREAVKHGLPAELPVMASLVESGLDNNPNQLDHDSVGYFQMRVGIWDQGAYKGFTHRPDLQLKWFLDEAEGVKKQWIAEGRSSALRDPSRYGEWIYGVERCAAEYKGRYQLRLGEARSLLRGEQP